MFARARRRARTLLLVAVVLGVAHLYLPAVVVFALALPSLIAWARRELAVGAALAAGRSGSVLARAPDRDLRAVYQRVR